MLMYLYIMQIQRIKHESEETEKALRERVQRLEMTRLQLEEEMSQLKTANMTDKLQAEENISLAKQRVKQEEVCIARIVQFMPPWLSGKGS